MVEIVNATKEDIAEIAKLVRVISEAQIIPNFDSEGRHYFRSIIEEDVKTTFDNSRFQAFKMRQENQIIGFGAIRDTNYITHLFVDVKFQGLKFGTQILERLLSVSSGGEVRLRASLSAKAFYLSQGFIATGDEQESKGIRYLPMIINWNPT